MDNFDDRTGGQDAFDDESETQPLQFVQLEGKETEDQPKPIDEYDNVNLNVSIELGRINLNVKEVLDLKEGSILETEKLSGNPMEILVNNQLFGRGEVVVVGDNLAIRITELFRVEEAQSEESEGEG